MDTGGAEPAPASSVRLTINASPEECFLPSREDWDRLITSHAQTASNGYVW